MSEKPGDPMLSPRVVRKKRRKAREPVEERDMRDSSAVSALSGRTDVGDVMVAERQVGVPDGGAWCSAELAAVGAEMRTIVLTSEAVPKPLAKCLLDLAARYEAIVLRQTAEVARLEGRLAERAEGAAKADLHRRVAAPAAPVAVPTKASPAVAPTYAVVVRSNETGEVNGEAVKQKVLAVGKTMSAVRVKSVRTLKDGGVAVIARTSSDAQAIRKAAAFAAAGLSVAEARMGEPHLIVHDVPADLTDAELLGDIVATNLAGVATTQEMSRIKVLRRVKKASGCADVILDVPAKLRECILNEGRIYAGWLSYRVREYESVPQCYGCGSYGHLLAHCNLGRLCHNCGGAGHVVGSCKESPRCRNCALRGLDATHRVTSRVCPCYMRECERRRGRVIG